MWEMVLLQTSSSNALDVIKTMILDDSYSSNLNLVTRFVNRNYHVYTSFVSYVATV